LTLKSVSSFSAADARPNLSNRYENYCWPATIVFNIDGSEIVKRQAYIPPEPMASMLQAIIDDPSPGPAVEYPNFEIAAGFVCTDRRRSAPILDPAKIAAFTARK
jgi:hypothetical protein